MLNLGCWNIRGMNRVNKQKEMRDFISKNNLSIYAVLESRVGYKKVEQFCRSMFGNWSWISNSMPNTSSTRIMVGSDPGVVSVIPVGFTDQVIHCFIKLLEGDNSFYGSFVYTANHSKPETLNPETRNHKP